MGAICREERARVQLRDAGAAATAVDIMRAHRNIISVQTAACKAIGHMSFDKASRSRCCDAGGAAEIVRVLRSEMAALVTATTPLSATSSEL